MWVNHALWNTISIYMNMLTGIAFLELVCHFFIQSIPLRCLVENKVVHIRCGGPSNLTRGVIAHVSKRDKL